MNLFKRLTTSVTATFDNAVGQLENHDAIVEATIRQTKQSVAKTRARINTLCQQQRAYESQLADAQEQHGLWTERATKLAKTDQAKALQCVARRNQCQTEIKRLNQLIEQQHKLVHEVTLNQHKLQSKLDEMTQKHNLMRSRQTVANVNRAVAKSSSSENLDDTFERWESVILEHEMAVNDVCLHDTLDMELSEQETQAELLAQLAELSEAQEQEKHNE